VTAAAGWHRPAYRTEVVRIFEPLGVAGEVVPHVLSRAQAYGEGLSRYRARDFAAAAAQFARVGTSATVQADCPTLEGGRGHHFDGSAKRSSTGLCRLMQRACHSAKKV
jgi:hypothetical protein